MYEKANQFVIFNINTTRVIIDNHMAMIQVQIGRNTIDGVLVDGGFGGKDYCNQKPSYDHLSRNLPLTICKWQIKPQPNP
jgi:hypothetical protein